MKSVVMGRQQQFASSPSVDEYANIVRERPPPFSLKRWMYNSKEGKYFGRTGSSWGKEIRQLKSNLRASYMSISFLSYLF